MPWNDQLRGDLLGNLGVFRGCYSSGRTLAVNPGNPDGGQLDDAALNRLRCVVKRITQLVPNAVCHDSPGYNETPVPHVVISRPLGQDMGGKLDGGTRIALYVVNGQIHIGLRARQGQDYAQDIGRRFANVNQAHDWVPWGIVSPNVPNYIATLIGNIGGDENDVDEGVWVGTLLQDGTPLAEFLVAANGNEDIFNRPPGNIEFNPPRVRTPNRVFPAIHQPDNNEPADVNEPVINESAARMNLNTILYGPPGTGKTFATLGLALSRFPQHDLGACGAAQLQEYAHQCLGGQFANPPDAVVWRNWVAQFDTLRQRGRIAFTTFHQNYAYEDFVEGIRAKAELGGVSYKEEPGIFKRIAYRALYACIENQEYPEQGNEAAQEAANTRVLDWLNRSEPLPNTGDAFPYVLVIDEINRGNMARILGELITLLEDSKRAQQAVTLGNQPLKVMLPYSREPFIVPPNLYILGTMNTADRSLIGLDVALRRRFSFVELAPQAQALQGEVAGIDLRTFFDLINKRIEEKLDAEHRIGHAFLTRATDLASLNLAMTQKVIPLLREYFHDRPQDLRYVLGQADNNNQCDFLEIAGEARTLRVKGLKNQGNYTAEHYRALYNVTHNNNGQA